MVTRERRLLRGRHLLSSYFLCYSILLIERHLQRHALLSLPSSLCLATFLFFYLLNTCFSLQTQLKCHFFHKAFPDHPFEIVARWIISMTFMLL